MTITPETLRIIRQVYRLTLEEMAAVLDTSTAGVWRLEHSERPITADIAALIKAEFELTPEKLARVLEIYEETGGRAARRVRVMRPA